MRVPPDPFPPLRRFSQTHKPWREPPEGRGLHATQLRFGLSKSPPPPPPRPPARRAGQAALAPPRIRIRDRPRPRVASELVAEELRLADQAGVHLIWNLPGVKGPERETELLYALDSPVAARLQACYGKLSELGYEVVDLAIWRKAPLRRPPETAPAATAPAMAMAKTTGKATSIAGALPQPSLSPEVSPKEAIKETTATATAEIAPLAKNEAGSPPPLRQPKPVSLKPLRRSRKRHR